MYVHVNVHIHMCVHVRTQVFVCVCPLNVLSVSKRIIAHSYIAGYHSLLTLTDGSQPLNLFTTAHGLLGAIGSGSSNPEGEDYRPSFI